MKDSKRRQRKPKKLAKKYTDQRRQIEESNLFIQNLDEPYKGVSDNGFVGRVVEVHKRYAFVSPEPETGNIATRDVWIASVARKYLQAARHERHLVAVGDRVWCAPGQGEVGEVSQELPQCVIECRDERSNELSRQDPHVTSRTHIIAANIDQLVVVASYLQPEVRWRLIDRYSVQAEAANLPMTIILNKADLLEEADEKFRTESLEYVELYKSLGYQVYSFAAKDCSTPPPELISIFLNRISTVTGHSGVGKSSIVNLLSPEIEQDVESETIFAKGRHTTTYASLIKLGAGGYVVDTPGVRSFAIEQQSSITLSWCFVEMRPFAGQCKYRECSHIKEPDCAIQSAVEQGLISKSRFDSYQTLLTAKSTRQGRWGSFQHD